MSGRKRLVSLILIIALNAVVVTAIAISFLYRAAIREEKERLVETAQSQARLIEAVARFDAAYHASFSQGDGAATLKKIIEAHNNYEKAGRTAEFTLGRREGDSIVFLLRHTHGDLRYPQRVKFDSTLAEPMRQALLGRSGTIIGLDYRGKKVLAAHEPVSELDAGIVAKIDLSEIRAPFVKAGALALVSAVVVVLIGAALLVRINRLEKRIDERTAELLTTNEKLAAEIHAGARLQKQLEQSRSMFQSVVDSISDPLILLNRELTVKMINRAAVEYYELSSFPDILNTTCHRMLKNSLTPCEGCEVPAAISGGKRVMFERKGFMDPDRIEHVYVYPVKLPGVDEKNVLLRISDVTEQRLFEKQLIHSEKMASIGLLASSIAHEINNPNNFISFNIPILREYIDEMMPLIEDYARERPDAEFCHMPYTEFRSDIPRILDNIEHGAGRINDFITNLKEFSQLKERVENRWIDLHSVVRKALSICSAQLNQHGQSVRTNLPDQSTWIWSDPNALEQILLNLLVNAAQASNPDGSHIELNVEVHDRWLEHTILEIRDYGEGMDETTQRKIFNPFFTLKSQNGGTGLGLYVCHNLVESLGGRIEVESAPGKGSTFRVILPDKDRRRTKRI